MWDIVCGTHSFIHHKLSPNALHKLGVGDIVLDGLVDKELYAVYEDHEEYHPDDELPHML